VTVSPQKSIPAKETQTMKIKAFLIVAPILLGATACTTIPRSSDGFLTRVDGLQAAKGVRGKRLATPPPSPPIERGKKLQIDAVRSVGTDTTSYQITTAERALIENALARNACNDLSKHFEIIGSDISDPEAYKLRIGVTKLEPTGRIGAAVGTASGFALPIGIRPPIGLGSLTVEFELLKPNGEQAAAMVWSQKADMVSSSAAASRIGDAYVFTSDATQDFARLATRQSTKNDGLGGIAILATDKPDEICAIYGRETNAAAQALSFLGVPVPPEMVDKGAKKP
jgi:hypothetical protein